MASFAFSFTCAWTFPSRLWNFYPLREKWPTVSGKGQCHGDEHGRSSCRSSDRVLRCRLAKSAWRGARVVESTCLESMRPSNGTVGSNPTLSATNDMRTTNLEGRIGENLGRNGTSEGGIRPGGSRGMCPPRGELTRGLAPSVGASAVSASATSNAHPLRHSWRDSSCRMVDRRAVARQPYQIAIKFSAHEKVSPGDKHYLEQ